jgi:hypothetical protein
MYISILNFAEGKVIIVDVDDSIDAGDYISENFGWSNVEWMTSDSLKLEINKEL